MTSIPEISLCPVSIPVSNLYPHQGNDYPWIVSAGLELYGNRIIFICVLLLLPEIMFGRFIPVVVYSCNLFILIAVWYYIQTVALVVHSVTNEHLDSYILFILNKATLNNLIHVFFLYFTILEKYTCLKLCM